MYKKIIFIFLFFFIGVKSIAQINSNDNIRNRIDSLNKINGKTESNDASFPGGEKAWKKYLVKNIDYKVPKKNKAPEGSYTVIINFFVGKDASITSAEAKTNIGYGMEEEAIRVIKQSPRWIPAYEIHVGSYLSSYRSQPISFVVQY